MNPHDAPSLRATFEHDPARVLRAAWRFSWWKRGGEPGPDWLSDKVDLVATNGRVAGQYTLARNAPAPPFRTHADEHTGEVPEALAAGLLRAIFAHRLYEQTFAAEGRANLADAVRHTFDLTIDAVHLEKTLHEPTRDELGEVGRACEAIAAHLLATGVARDVTRA